MKGLDRDWPSIHAVQCSSIHRAQSIQNSKDASPLMAASLQHTTGSSTIPISIRGLVYLMSSNATASFRSGYLRNKVAKQSKHHRVSTRARTKPAFKHLSRCTNQTQSPIPSWPDTPPHNDGPHNQNPTRQPDQTCDAYRTCPGRDQKTYQRRDCLTDKLL